MTIHTNLEKSNKKTLLFLSWRDIKCPKMGGAEIFTHEMLARLDSDKYRIIHFSPFFENALPYEYVDNILYIRKGNLLSVIIEAKKYYKKNSKNIDFVVDQCNTHRFFTPLWVEASKRIFFIHQLTREIWYFNSKFPMSTLGYITETPLLKLSKNDQTITVSNSTKNDLLKIGFNKNKLHILPEGIEFNHWTPDKFLPKENVPTFCYVGRFSNYKGIDATIKAFGLLKKSQPDAKLWIIGKKNDDYIETVLAPLCEKENISYGSICENKDITFYGFVDNDKKLELMSKSHALIFPSKREGWGLIVTEAAAVGTPSIVYNSPGIVDAVDFGHAGYMCKQNTPEAIYELMKKVIDDKKEYETMKNNAYKFALKFHWDNTSKAFDDFISNL